MGINEYQDAIQEYKQYQSDINIFYDLIDITSSVGDLNKKLNNILINNQEMTNELSLKLGISLGDILYAISNFATDIGLKMEDVALLNLRKINMQKESDLKKKNNQPIKIE